MRALLSSQDPAWPPPILDIEASGFGRDSYPIEVGFVLSNGQAWCSLIRREPEWTHWDEAAQAMHRITRESLEQHGRAPAQVVETLDNWLRGQVVYSDAWAHDYSWLNQLYEAAGRAPSFKLENLRALLSDDEAGRWHEVKQQVSSTVELARHRASSDARLLQMTLKRMRARNRPGGSIERMRA